MLRVRLIRMGLAFGVMLGMASIAYADGTEILGPPSIAIAEGSGIAVGGVGLIGGPGDIVVDVPVGAEVKQVLLYWNTGIYQQTVSDTTLTVNGVEVTGTSIGGPTLFFSVVEFEAFRADITDLGLVQDGVSTLSIDGFESAFETTGAGVVVIYDDGGQPLSTDIVDGLDLAYFRFEGTLLERTVPQTFYFEPADYERVGNIILHVASVGDMRPNITEVTMNGVTEQYFNLFTSAQGPEWDAQILPVTVPPGTDSLTVELISASDGSTNNPASLAWTAGGLAIEKPVVKDDCGECDGKVSELTLQYNGRWGTYVKVTQRVQGPQHQRVIFNGYVRPGDTFTLVGADNQGTLGPEIKIYTNCRLSASIHTSCSEPIGPGLVEGDFELVSGTSRNGGELCPIEEEEPPTNGCPDIHSWLQWLFKKHYGHGWGR